MLKGKVHVSSLGCCVVFLEENFRRADAGSCNKKSYNLLIFWLSHEYKMKAIVDIFSERNGPRKAEMLYADIKCG
jgi:hypothetical protein